MWLHKILDTPTQDECQLIESYDSVSFSQFLNYLQIGGAGIVYAIPITVGSAIAISPIGWISAMGAGGIVAAIFDMLGGVAVAAGGSTLLAYNFDSLDIFRLYDYVKIYKDDFLEDDEFILVFPEDTIEDIIDELM